MTRALLTAQTDTDAAKLLGDVGACEQAMFMGLWRLTHGKEERAALDFAAGEKACPLDSIERSEAHVELSLLKTLSR